MMSLEGFGFVEQIETLVSRVFMSSLSATVLILLGYLALLFFRKYLTPKWQFAFGIVVIARLLLPVVPESQLSFLNLWYGSESLILEEVAASQAPDSFEERFPGNQSIADGNLTSGTEFRQIDAPVDLRGFPNLFQIFGIIWATGTLGIVSWVLVRWVRLIVVVKRQGTREHDPDLLTILNECRATMGMTKAVPLVKVSQVPAAALLGWLKPKLLISDDFAERFSKAEIRGIFLHELGHIQRRDVAWNWIAFFTQALHWFNPFVWITLQRFQMNREILCDAAALRHLSTEERRAYGETLISIFEKASKPNPPALIPSFASILPRNSEIKSRIAMINQHYTSPHWTVQVCGYVIAGLAIFTTFSRAETEPSTAQETETVVLPDEIRIELVESNSFPAQVQYEGGVNPKGPEPEVRARFSSPGIPGTKLVETLTELFPAQAEIDFSVDSNTKELLVEGLESQLMEVRRLVSALHYDLAVPGSEQGSTEYPVKPRIGLVARSPRRLIASMGLGISCRPNSTTRVTPTLPAK